MKKLINGKIFTTLLMFALVFSIFVNKTPVRASSIIIAASNSSNTWKSQATATCTGSNDQSIINKYLTSGNTVELSPGTFSINGLIVLASGNTLFGQGNKTILNMVGNNGGIYSAGVGNLTIYGLEIAGKEYSSGGIFIAANGLTVSNFYIHDITNVALGGDDFVLYADNGTIANTSFVRCDASNPDGFGFLVNGAGSPATVTNLAFFQCSVENAAVASTRTNPWVTGFDLAEYGSMTVKNEYVINCSVNGAWESDFHYEASPTKTNCVIVGSSAANGGEKPGALYGAGYLLDGRSDIILLNNQASSDSVAAIRAWNGSTYVNITPVANKIYPSSTIKTDLALSQGNCSGVIINTDAIHKELILYSTDGNPVNQQIPLAGYYTSSDGNTYTFVGTNLVAQFTNYTVIGLVKSNSPTLAFSTGSLPSGTVGTAYSQTLTATGGTFPYTWTITSGILPAGLSLSSSGIISGTPTTEAGVTSTTFQVTDSAGTNATNKLSITINNIRLSITTSSLANGIVGTAYLQTLTATGGTDIYTWTIDSGALPAGLSLGANGIISGTPTITGGPTPMTFHVTDSAGANASTTLSITINRTRRYRSY